jgi:hypothetical protein
MPPPMGYPSMNPHVVPGRTPLATTPSAHAWLPRYNAGARASSPTGLEQNWVIPPPVDHPSAGAHTIIPSPMHDLSPSSVTEDYRLRYSAMPKRGVGRAGRPSMVAIDFEERLRRLRGARPGDDGVMNHEISRPPARIHPHPEPEEYESHDGVNNPATDESRTGDGPVPDETSQHSTPTAQLQTPASVEDALRVSCCTRRSTQKSLRLWCRRSASHSWRALTSSARLCVIRADSAIGSTGILEIASPSCVE